ncbi:MAG: response regulator, partial [Planctomycetota bacterium]|nr:response regulator [Planctomycetota bacterium]
MKTKAILVVDDNERLLRVYETALREAGYTVDVAADGQEAFRLFSGRGGYDLVVMDINMPNWDGIDAIRTMSVIKPDVKIIVISGVLDQERYQSEKSDLPIVAAYQKPMEIKEFLRAVQA